MDNYEEKNQVREIERKERKVKEMSIDNFARNNQGATDEFLRQYYSGSQDAQEIFGSPDAFVDFVGNADKIKIIEDRVITS